MFKRRLIQAIILFTLIAPFKASTYYEDVYKHIQDNYYDCPSNSYYDWVEGRCQCYVGFYFEDGTCVENFNYDKDLHCMVQYQSYGCFYDRAWGACICPYNLI